MSIFGQIAGQAGARAGAAAAEAAREQASTVRGAPTPLQMREAQDYNGRRGTTLWAQTFTDPASPELAQLVFAYQRLAGLPPDGKLGPRTLESMEANARDGGAGALSREALAVLAGWTTTGYMPPLRAFGMAAISPGDIARGIDISRRMAERPESAEAGRQRRRPPVRELPPGTPPQIRQAVPPLQREAASDPGGLAIAAIVLLVIAFGAKALS